MSRIGIRFARKKLTELLSRANDDDFLALVWAIDAVQSGRSDRASRYLQYPKEAENSDVDGPYAMHKWDLESIVTVLLTTPKYEIRPGLNRLTDSRSFNTMVAAINYLRKLEDAEVKETINDENIFAEIHRIGHRQFPWQRGFANAEILYRYIFVYGQGACAEYFEKQHGLTVNEFSLISVVMFWQLSQNPWLIRSDLSSVGISREKVMAAFKLLTLSISEARKQAVALQRSATLASGKMTRTIYLPSILRQRPILVADNMNGRVLAPLPQLVLYRATSGLFYDIVNGGTPIINDANTRFEEYCRKLIVARCPLFEVQASHKYKLGKNWGETPDVLVKLEGQIELVFECKATKLTYAAQYADDPILEAKNAYTQIAKGVYQIWKFFSHARRGLFAAETVSPKARGALLTMEAFGQLWGDMQQRILQEATVLASVGMACAERLATSRSSQPSAVASTP